MTPPPSSPYSPPPASAAGPPTPLPHGARTENIRFKERIYAVITMIAVVVALAEDDGIGHLDAVWTITATALGVWLVTLVADQQAYRVVNHRLARGDDLRLMLYTSGPMLLSAIGPLIFTAVSALGLLGLQNALLVAVFVELAGLFAWGLLGGLRLGSGLFAATIAATTNLVIGLVIVAIKVVTSR
jgi:hypothetical protein